MRHDNEMMPFLSRMHGMLSAHKDSKLKCGIACVRECLVVKYEKIFIDKEKACTPSLHTAVNNFM